jgi:hypothetical protein
MSVITDLEQEFKNLVAKLEAKGEVIKADVYAEALLIEARVKTEIVLLRQRAANLASDAEVEAEKAVIYAKEFLAKLLTWIQALEQKLGTSAKDFNTGEPRSE